MRSYLRTSSPGKNIIITPGNKHNSAMHSCCVCNPMRCHCICQQSVGLHGPTPQLLCHPAVLHTPLGCFRPSAPTQNSVLRLSTKLFTTEGFPACPAHAMLLHISVLVIDVCTPKWWHTVQLSQFYLTNLYRFCSHQSGTGSSLPAGDRAQPRGCLEVPALEIRAEGSDFPKSGKE